MVEPYQKPDFDLQMVLIGMGQYVLAAAQSPENSVLSQAYWATSTPSNPCFDTDAPRTLPIPKE